MNKKLQVVLVFLVGIVAMVVGYAVLTECFEKKRI